MFHSPATCTTFACISSSICSARASIKTVVLPLLTSAPTASRAMNGHEFSNDRRDAGTALGDRVDLGQAALP
jgi:hypothetical protein